MSQLANIKKKLLTLKPELLEKYHVSSIGLFGSIVRDDFNAESDVDIIVDFDQNIGIEFIDLAEFLESRINKAVDLVSRKGVKPAYFKIIEEEIVYV